MNEDGDCCDNCMFSCSTFTGVSTGNEGLKTYASIEKGGILYCRRNPPTLIHTANTGIIMSEFSWVAEDNWCGNYLRGEIE